MTRLGSGKGSKYSFEADPIVIDGVMYIPTGNDDIFALDAKTGRKIWEYNSDIPQVNDLICCGWDNRGVAAGEGKIFSGQLDGSFVALDQKTGKIAWRTQLEDYHDGYSITGATRYYDGLVFTGMSGGENGIRGRLYALDAKTGQEVWRFYTVPNPGEIGGDTWPMNDPDPVKRRRSTSTAAAPSGRRRRSIPSSGCCTSARATPVRGTARCALATTCSPPRSWRSTTRRASTSGTSRRCTTTSGTTMPPSPTVLFDQTYNGTLRKGMYQAARPAGCYILDRTNGQPLIGIDETPVPQEPRKNTCRDAAVSRVGDAFVDQCARGRCRTSRSLAASSRRSGTSRSCFADGGGRLELQSDCLQPADRLRLRRWAASRTLAYWPNDSPVRAGQEVTRRDHRHARSAHDITNTLTAHGQPHEQDRLARSTASAKRTRAA